MKIRHKEYGDVDGVVIEDRAMYACWMKDGATYHGIDGWSLVQPERVNVTGDVEIERSSDGDSYFHHGDIEGIDYLHKEYTFSKVQRYNLPDGWYQKWMNNGPDLERFINQYKEPCIIVEKDV